MTREMIKPDWHSKWKDVHIIRLGDIKVIEYKKERKLDDWIKPFVDSVNERFKQNGN